MRVLMTAVLVMVVLAGAGSAAVIPVPGPYGPTIQAAIDAANPAGGDVIQVAAGVYPQLLSVTKPLSLLGAGSGSTTIDASLLTGPGTVVTLSPASGNVTFDGFTVKAGAQLFTLSHSTPSPLSVITISHNHFIGHNQEADDTYDFGVIGGYGGVGKVVVSANTFDNYYNNPILFERHLGASEVVGNTIQIADGADGIFYMTYDNEDVAALQSVRENTLTHQGSNRCGGIYVNSATWYAGDRRGRFENIEILNNTVYGVGAQKRGIGLGNDCATGDGSEGEIVSPRIRGNVIQGLGSTDNNRGLQLIGYITNADVRNNSFNNLQEGIRVWDGAYSPGYFPVGTQIQYNSLASCNSYGLNWTGPAKSPLAAEMNWWGSATGPAPGGSGSRCSDNVDFDPWIGKAGGENIVCDPDPEYLTASVPTKTIAVKYLGGGGGLLYGYSLKFSWTSSVVSTTPADVHQGTLLSSAGTTFFYASSLAPHEITVDCALLGDQPGVTGSGTMFTIDFTGTAVGTSPIDITILNTRDRNNQPIGGFYENDGLLIVDVSKPVVTNVKIWNDTLVTDDYIKNGDLARLAATVKDDDPTFDKTRIWANLSGLRAGGAAVNPDTYDWASGAAVWNAWTAACNPTDGTVTVTVDATDAMGNPAVQGSDTIIADNTKPTAVTGFDASPSNEECVLTWTMGSDAHPAGVTVRRLGNSEYPTYPLFVAGWPGGLGGYYPATYADGTEVYNGAGTGVTDAVVPRDIYYYQAFCYDAAMNYGLAASTARDLATNYWLGDVASIWGVWGFNGLVNDNDIDRLGSTYHVSGPGSPENQCDVGPTVHPDYHRLGLPKPDNFVGFEDLMVFAMNYGVVAPKIAPLLDGPADEALALSLRRLSASAAGEISVALRLNGNAGDVKGLSAAITYDAGRLEFMSARLADGMASPVAQVFFWGAADGGKVLLDLAVLGTGVTIGGSGDVAVLTFRALGGEYSLDFAEATIRGVENDVLDADLQGATSESADPTVFRLVQNAPNPFNPVTTVKYEVPFESAVTIQVYDVAGREVRTLVSGNVQAGRHAAVWDGRNGAGESVGSGVYFCVMEAPGYHGSQKMILMK